jgi:hypothetical protein
VIGSNDHLTAIRRRERAPSTTSGAVVSRCSNVKPKLFDHLISAGEQRRWHIEAERPRGLEIDDEFDLRRLFDG